MKKSNRSQETVDWRPQWEGEDLKEFERIRDSFKAEVASFRSLRQALGLSQAEAAERLATSQSNVSKIEAKSDPSLSLLRKLIGSDGELRLFAHLKDGSDFQIAIGG